MCHSAVHWLVSNVGPKLKQRAKSHKIPIKLMINVVFDDNSTRGFIYFLRHICYSSVFYISFPEYFGYINIVCCGVMRWLCSHSLSSDLSQIHNLSNIGNFSLPSFLHFSRSLETERVSESPDIVVCRSTERHCHGPDPIIAPLLSSHYLSPPVHLFPFLPFPSPRLPLDVISSRLCPNTPIVVL